MGGDVVSVRTMLPADSSSRNHVLLPALWTTTFQGFIQSPER